MIAEAGHDLEALLEQARSAERDGSPAAADLWRQVLEVSPEQLEALLNLSRQVARRGDGHGALELLRRAEAAAPDQPLLALESAGACQRIGDAEGEYAAIDRALAADPFCLQALLVKAALLERRGDTRRAAGYYRAALRVAPESEKISPAQASGLARARATVDRNTRAFDDFIGERMRDVMRRYPGERVDRVIEGKDAALGKKKIYVHAPSMLNVARLPAIQFYDDDLFPWMPALEAQTEVIVEELTALIARQADFTPYVNRPKGVPLNQWGELNNSLDWSVFHLWKHGERIDANCAACPRTAKILADLPMAYTERYSPNALFSTLKAGAHIPPHSGVTNARLVAHMPLILPDQCAFRVGNETRPWAMGKAWVFDDSIEHEAWNHSNRDRVILIFDVWNPLLSEAEREMVNAFLQARLDYYSGEGE